MPTDSSEGLEAGKVSTGFIHATPGDMKSFKSSAESIALMATVCERWMRRHQAFR